MAELCDVFVMDAFGTSHRAQGSTEGVARLAQEACAGPLLSAELAALGQALADPARPMLAIVGGSKVSTKLEVLDAPSGRRLVAVAETTVKTSQPVEATTAIGRFVNGSVGVLQIQ